MASTAALRIGRTKSAPVLKAGIEALVATPIINEGRGVAARRSAMREHEGLRPGPISSRLLDKIGIEGCRRPKLQATVCTAPPFSPNACANGPGR